MKNSSFLILIISGIFTLALLTNSCQKEPIPGVEINSISGHSFFGDNIQPYQEEKTPEATVKLLSFEKNSTSSRDYSSSLTPGLFEALLAPGASVTEDLTATITLPIERGDVMFMFDLTKSMQQELSNVKVNTQNIMGAIGVEISDVNFGVVSHMDYIGTYDYCGYEDRYGGSQYGDYPYQLNQSITSETDLVTQAINDLEVGWGWDYPECYSRVLYEMTAPDAEIGWRESAKRIVVAWLDNQPHDCNLGTGPDPGRDEIVNTSDDLEISDVLSTLADQNIVLFVLYSGGDPGGGEHLEIWEDFCAVTGGAAYRINQDGTVPDDVDIAEYIADFIEEEVTHIDQLTLQVCDEEFESWLTNVNPEVYTDINESSTFPFTVEFTVPDGTEDGVYEFDLCLMGDGIEFGSQHVKIRVFDGLAVPFDVKPTGCPNPFNINYNGELPVALLGFAGFNVRNINKATINIQGVYPNRNTYADVATPYYPFLNKDLDAMSCNTAGSDSREDLTLKFSNQQIANLLSGYSNGDLVRIYIEGELNDGTHILGEDIVRIVNSDQQNNIKIQ